MAINKIALYLVFFLLFFFFTPSFSSVAPSAPVNSTTACNATTDPKFCRSVLPDGGPRNMYFYGRFSVSKSLSNARKFLKLVARYLAGRSTLSPSAVLALEDCHLLSQLNIDFLTSAAATLNGNDTLLDPQAEKVQTLLSALLTNQQTCSDGLQATASASPVRKDLKDPNRNSTKLYSVSLALFAKTWSGNRRFKSRKHFTPARVPTRRNLLFHEAEIRGRDAALPLEMARPKRHLFEKWSGRRRLLQSSTDAVLVVDIVTVSPVGAGDYKTITEAVAAAPNNLDGSTGYFLIYVDAGIYQEYVVIPKNKKYLMMIGDGINRTVITGDHNVADGWTTFNSSSFAVVGQGFVAIDMTFRNTAGPAKHQAVAVRNGADLSTFYSCSFEGYQDTLYAHSMRQFYRECDIYGTVDFIFGNAAVVFQDCNVYARLPMLGQSNVATAQGRTDPNQNTGTSIQGCRILAAPDLAVAGGPTSTKTYLGRPWKQYSRTVVMQSYIDSLVDPSGWVPWDGSFALDTLYYAEYNNTGPESSTAGRVTWSGYHPAINSSDASNFTVSSFLMGDNWLPQTGVPYDSGLL